MDMELGFTDIRNIVIYIIDWLKEFLAAFDELAKGFENKFAGYTPVPMPEAEEN